MQLLDALAHCRAVLLAEGDVLSLAYRAAVHASDGDTANVAAVVERRDEHLRVAFELLRFGYVLDYGVEHGQDIVGRLLPVGAHPAVFGRTVDCGEVELVLGGVETEHQVEHHLLHLVGTAVGFIDLVDYHHRLEPHLYSLLEHETRLRHRAFESVDKQEAAVGHVEHALNLAAEVGVSRGVDYIDFVSFVVDGYVF